MTAPDNTLVQHHTIFDDWRSVTIGVHMALVGYGVMVVVMTTYEWTLWLRLVAGVGKGIFTAVAMVRSKLSPFALAELRQQLERPASKPRSGPSQWPG